MISCGFDRWYWTDSIHLKWMKYHFDSGHMTYHSNQTMYIYFVYVSSIEHHIFICAVQNIYFIGPANLNQLCSEWVCIVHMCWMFGCHGENTSKKYCKWGKRAWKAEAFGWKDVWKFVQAFVSSLRESFLNFNTYMNEDWKYTENSI